MLMCRQALIDAHRTDVEGGTDIVQGAVERLQKPARLAQAMPECSMIHRASVLARRSPLVNNSHRRCCQTAFNGVI